VQLEELKKTSDFEREGLMEVFIINPTMEEYKDKLGMERRSQNGYWKVEMVTRRYG
jgi:hypothetical protein